jgi:hypothetical protein
VPPNYPFVRAEGEVEYGDVMTVGVEFENRSDTTKRVIYYPWLHADFEEFRGTDAFEPQSAEAVLSPGERTTVEFSLDTEALPYNERLRVANFTLYGYLLSNFEIYMGSRPLVLRSDPELPDDVAPSVIQEP